MDSEGATKPVLQKKVFLTILAAITEKNCRNNLIQELVKKISGLLLIIVDRKKISLRSYFWLMFTQPIKALHMFEQRCY